MLRSGLVLLVLGAACKKQESVPAPEPEAVPPVIGHSKTKLKGSAAGEAAGEASAQAPGDAAVEPADAQLYGGNGQPAYRDADGRIRGPGGPIFMGRGPDCTDKLDHCLRDGVWFAVGTVVPGKLYRATPVFEFEGQWYSFRERQEDWQTLFKTKVVERSSELVPGGPVVWLIEETSTRKWLNSEHDALTSSRWEVGVIDTVGSSTFTVKGWPGAIPVDTARVIVDQKRS